MLVRMSLSLENAIAMLSRIDLFAGFDHVRLEVLAFTAERRVFEAGATLFENGAVADAAYLILAGEAAMLGHAGAGEEALAMRLQPGDFVGERALLAGELRRSSVRAVTRVETLRINRDLFLRLIGEFPEMGDAVSRALRLRLGALSDDMKALSDRLSAREGRKET